MMLRAVIYCRCSTEEESQIDALKHQVAEARECVRQQGWILVDEYVESKSGTSTKGRNEYNRLFEDVLKNKFDIIIIKSIDRLMRNTRDWFVFLDRISSSGKKLYMYIDQKFYTPDDALITGIKAILAEEYSRELSKKINNAHRNRQKNGGKPILTSNVYGIKKMADGSYELIPEEAKIKVYMYELFAAGYGSRTVSNILKNEGIVNRKGVPFNANNILRMIKNPLNMGTIVMNSVHYEFDLKKSFKTSEEERYVYPNKIPAIVSEELWLKANQEVRKRTSKRNNPDSSVFGKNPGKCLYTGKIYCGCCGQVFYRKMRRRYKDNEPIYDWKCNTYSENGRNEGDMARPHLRKVQLNNVQGCNNVHLNEEKLNDFLEGICKKRYQPDKEQILNKMIAILSKVLKEKDLQPDINVEVTKKEKLEKQLSILLEKLLEGIISDELYRKKQTEIEQQLKASSEKIKNLTEQMAKGSELQERMITIRKALQEGDFIKKASIAGMLEEIDKIVVFPERMEIHFSYAKMLGISTENLSVAESEVMTIEYGSYFNPRQQQKENLQAIVDCMKENPHTTAKQIAEKIGITTSGVQQRIKKLRELNRIQFVGKGGRGYWEVLEE